jgi:hypothetical protein
VEVTLILSFGLSGAESSQIAVRLRTIRWQRHAVTVHGE